METAMLSRTMLFRGMSEGEISAVLQRLSAAERVYGRDAVLFHAGSTASRFGMVLSGSVRIESNDVWGERTILSVVGQGQCFAESYALLPKEKMLVDVTANEDCRVLLMDLSVLREPAAKTDAQLTGLLLNLVTISAHKNLALSARSFHTAPKTIRARVMSYLYSVSLRCGKLGFDVPFDRQQLADYLNVERSALSKELGRMRRDGIIRVRKNHFELIEKGREENP